MRRKLEVQTNYSYIENTLLTYSGDWSFKLDSMIWAGDHPGLKY